MGAAALRLWLESIPVRFLWCNRVLGVMMRQFLTTAVVFLVGGAGLFAQTPVVGVGTFIHVVANLDKTMRFYGDRLGLELTGAPGPRVFSANAVVENLYDAKGSQSRVAVFKIPGSPLGVEFVEFKDVSQKPFRPRLEDPGASLLTLPVRDLDSVMTKLKDDATPVVSDGGAKRTAVVKDPDGFYIQLAEGGSNATLSLTVDRRDRTLHLFRDLLGFQPDAGGTAKVPGTEFEVTFVEFKAADRRMVAESIHDPGAGVLRLVVRDVDALLQTLKSAGVPVVTAEAEPVSVGNRHFVILRDPDNFFFQLVPQPNPAPR
jgi:catechol 2,3-dioxygenase-like lactoylglutathione lyase family enzyme